MAAGEAAPVGFGEGLMLIVGRGSDAGFPLVPPRFAVGCEGDVVAAAEAGSSFLGWVDDDDPSCSRRRFRMRSVASWSGASGRVRWGSCGGSISPERSPEEGYVEDGV